MTKIFWQTIGVTAIISVILLAGFLNFRNSATFYYRNEVRRLSESRGQAQELPAKFIISPGEYRFGQKTYNLRDEGLYRFQEGKEITQRIVYLSDPWAILSGLAWVEGPWAPYDKKLKPSQATEKILKGNISLSCGNIAALADIILTQEKIEARSVMGLNLEYSWQDEEDNGHTMLEVKVDNQWVAVDVDNNVTFLSGDRRLSLWDFFQKISDNEDYEMEYLSLDSNGRSEKELRAYYQKMYQVPFINEKRFWYFTAEGEAKEKAQQYSHKYKYMDQDKWLEKFYSVKID